METILEQQRRYHEERERLMDAMVKEIMHKKSGVSKMLFCFNILGYEVNIIISKTEILFFSFARRLILITG